MNLVNEGVLPPDELDDRDERRELAEALLTKPAENVNSGAGSDSRDNSGNAAKLREALREAIGETCLRCTKDCGDCLNLKAGWMAKAKAALSAPPRNCDRYATADEALKAQEQMFNDSNFANGECKLGCPECDNPRVGCKIAWLFATATEKEGGAKE